MKLKHHAIRISHDATQKKCPYVVHFNVPPDCFETNLGHQTRYPKGGENLVGVAVYWDRKAVWSGTRPQSWLTETQTTF